MRLIRGQTSISVPKNNFRFSGKPRQPTSRQDQNRSHVQFPQSAHTESKELAPTFLRREVARAFFDQVDRAVAASDSPLPVTLRCEPASWAGRASKGAGLYEATTLPTSVTSTRADRMRLTFGAER